VHSLASNNGRLGRINQPGCSLPERIHHIEDQWSKSQKKRAIQVMPVKVKACIASQLICPCLARTRYGHQVPGPRIPPPTAHANIEGKGVRGGLESSWSYHLRLHKLHVHKQKVTLGEPIRYPVLLERYTLWRSASTSSVPCVALSPSNQTTLSTA
jgi:hypothetical protein